MIQKAGKCNGDDNNKQKRYLPGNELIRSNDQAKRNMGTMSFLATLPHETVFKTLLMKSYH
eukprot:1069957-Amphidinium_carterae.1